MIKLRSKYDRYVYVGRVGGIKAPRWAVLSHASIYMLDVDMSYSQTSFSMFKTGSQNSLYL